MTELERLERLPCGPLLLALSTLALACGGDTGEAQDHQEPCEEAVHWAALPDVVRETSGVAASRASPGTLWTHNDSGGEAAVFALDSTGVILGRIRIRGARNQDWEDIAVAPCGPGGGNCLFIGDTGDNREVREEIVVYRVREPDPGDSVSAPATALRAVYPDRPRDAEGLFVTSAGIHVVSKGRTSAVDLFRMPHSPDATGETPPVTLRRVQQLAPPPTSVSAQTTAAAASNDGRLVVIRTYAALQFYQAEADTLRPLGPAIDLSSAGQLQGEGVDFLNGDRLVLTGEAGGAWQAGIAAVRCNTELLAAPNVNRDSNNART
ncbi:MAG TPA: hypothetical protein VK966_08880 [Longimicrobiales bacterium]|nr:hypothetical protein [Longimicrobiales bacterium]